MSIMTFRGGTDNDSRLDGGPAGPVIFSGGGNLSDSGLIPVASEGLGDMATMPSDLPEVVENDKYPVPFDSRYGSRSQDMRPTLNGQDVSCDSQRESSRKSATRCGLSKRGRWIAIIILTATFIASMVGGLAGGLANRTASKQRQEQVDAPDTQPKPKVPKGTPINSQLAAINFIDSNFIVRRAFFYQKGPGSLMASYLVEDTNNTWITLNITDGITHQDDQQYLPPKNGAPLAAGAIPYGKEDFAGRRFAVVLYYIAEDHTIQELVSYDEELREWELGLLQYSQKLAITESQLAVAPRFYLNEDSSSPHKYRSALCIMYQRQKQRELGLNLRLRCADHWEYFWDVTSGYPGTSLTMVPMVPEYKANASRQSRIRMFWQRDLSLMDSFLAWDDDNAYTGTGDDITILDQRTVNGVLPKVVAAPTQAQDGTIVISMTGDGDFIGTWYKLGSTPEFENHIQFYNEGDSDQATISPRDFKLSALAMDHAGWFYGMAADYTRVVRYTWDPESPFKLHWQQEIKI